MVKCLVTLVQETDEKGQRSHPIHLDSDVESFTPKLGWSEMVLVSGKEGKNWKDLLLERFWNFHPRVQ